MSLMSLVSLAKFALLRLENSTLTQCLWKMSPMSLTKLCSQCIQSCQVETCLQRALRTTAELRRETHRCQLRTLTRHRHHWFIIAIAVIRRWDPFAPLFGNLCPVRLAKFSRLLPLLNFVGLCLLMLLPFTRSLGESAADPTIRHLGEERLVC